MSRIQKDAGLQVYMARKGKCFLRVPPVDVGECVAWMCIRVTVCRCECVRVPEGRAPERALGGTFGRTSSPAPTQMWPTIKRVTLS